MQGLRVRIRVRVLSACSFCDACGKQLHGTKRHLLCNVPTARRITCVLDKKLGRSNGCVRVPGVWATDFGDLMRSLAVSGAPCRTATTGNNDWNAAHGQARGASKIVRASGAVFTRYSPAAFVPPVTMQRCGQHAARAREGRVSREGSPGVTSS